MSTKRRRTRGREGRQMAAAANLGRLGQAPVRHRKIDRALPGARALTEEPLPAVTVICPEGHRWATQARDGAAVRCPRCRQEDERDVLVVVRRTPELRQ